MKKNQATVERIFNSPTKFKICSWCFKLQLKNRVKCIKCKRTAYFRTLDDARLERLKDSFKNWLKPIDV